MSATTTQNYTTSTYLIDASKKIYIGGAAEAGKFPDNAPDTLKGISVFAAGIIDDKALQNLGFEYKEGFTSGKKVAEARFEDAVKPATMAVKALTGALPIMKGIGSKVDSAEKLRTTAIEGYTLLAGTTTLLGNSNTDTSVTEQLDKWQAVYRYDPPVRKGPPSVDFPGNTIDITFRYGACNVFDAFWEVYYPITQIYKSIFPREQKKDEKDSLGSGLVEYAGQFKVPYEQQVFVELLKNILPKKKDNSKNPNNTSTTSTTDTGNIFVDLRELASAKSTLDREADLFEERKNNLINGLDSSLDDYTVGDAKKTPNYANLIHDKIFQAVGLGDSVEIKDIRDAVDTGDDKGSLYKAISGLIETAIDKKRMEGDVLITDGKWETKLFKNPLTKPLESNLPTSSGGIKVQVQKPKTSNKSATLKEVFNSLVTFEPRAIGNTLENIYKGWVTNCCSKIYFGFPCVYGRSLSDFKNTIYNTPENYAKVCIQNIVLGNVAVNFNFSNTDERGYPLEGHVILKGMWNCTLPQEVLSFNGYTYEEKGNKYIPKDTIKMEGQS